MLPSQEHPQARTPAEIVVSYRLLSGFEPRESYPGRGWALKSTRGSGNPEEGGDGGTSVEAILAALGLWMLTQAANPSM
jgi:hypothetical protein